jgi:hypothetical protein
MGRSDDDSALAAEVDRLKYELTRERDEEARAEVERLLLDAERERGTALRVVEAARAWLRYLEVERQAAYLDGVPGELMDALDEHDEGCDDE